MLAYVLKRFFLLLIVIFGVTILTFALMHGAPGDVAEMIAISRYGVENITAEDIEGIRIAEGLNAPLWVQYFHWLYR
jgi:peptide/nickel transport system permease protein